MAENMSKIAQTPPTCDRGSLRLVESLIIPCTLHGLLQRRIPPSRPAELSVEAAIPTTPSPRLRPNRPAGAPVSWRTTWNPGVVADVRGPSTTVCTRDTGDDRAVSGCVSPDHAGPGGRTGADPGLLEAAGGVAGFTKACVARAFSRSVLNQRSNSTT